MIQLSAEQGNKSETFNEIPEVLSVSPQSESTRLPHGGKVKLIAALSFLPQVDPRAERPEASSVSVLVCSDFKPGLYGAPESCLIEIYGRSEFGKLGVPRHDNSTMKFFCSFTGHKELGKAVSIVYTVIKAGAAVLKFQT